VIADSIEENISNMKNALVKSKREVIEAIVQSKNQQINKLSE
jgi:hypothetical protein